MLWRVFTRRAMIFEQPFGTTYLTIFLFSLFNGQKRMEKEKGRERVRI